MRISLTIDGISIDAPTGKEQGRFRIVQPGEVVVAVGYYAEYGQTVEAQSER